MFACLYALALILAYLLFLSAQETRPRERVVLSLIRNKGPAKGLVKKGLVKKRMIANGDSGD